GQREGALRLAPLSRRRCSWCVPALSPRATWGLPCCHKQGEQGGSGTASGEPASACFRMRLIWSSLSAYAVERPASSFLASTPSFSARRRAALRNSAPSVRSALSVALIVPSGARAWIVARRIRPLTSASIGKVYVGGLVFFGFALAPVRF